MHCSTARFKFLVEFAGYLHDNRYCRAAGGAANLYNNDILRTLIARWQCSMHSTVTNRVSMLTQRPSLLLLPAAAGQVVLGIWGNADATRPSQWLPVQSSGWPAATDLEWSEATATCSNVITGFDINIVTGIAFASGNLQSKVLYAQVCFSVGSWSFNQMAGQTLQNFPLQFTASFVPKQQQPPALSLKPAPPLFAPLPPDLFYPFRTSAAERGGQPLGVLVLLAASVALQLLFVDRV